MNTIICPRCDLEMISEEYRGHKCMGEFKGTKTIPVSFYYDGGLDENNDKLLMIVSEDGFIYRAVQCTHEIPHNLESTENLQGEDQPQNGQNLVLGAV